MTAAQLLAEAQVRGVQVFAERGELRYRAPRGALTDELRSGLSSRRNEVLALLGKGREAEDPEQPDLLERFLADSSLPAAIFRSRALGRDFVLARDGAALKALTEKDRRIPVLFFADCIEAQKMGLEGLRVLLDARETFGPCVELRSVRAV